MTGRWWRAYDEAVDDPKLIMLSDRAHRAWFNLMCVTSAHGGMLPNLKIVAVKLRMTLAKTEAIVGELKNAELLDETADGLRPHNWDGRQFKSDVSTDRVKQHRKRKGGVSRNGQRNVSSPDGETPPESETDTEAETDSPSLRSGENRAREGALVVSDWPTDYRERFWDKYPNKVGKADALGKLDRVKKHGTVPFAVLMAGLDRYVRKTDDRAWCNPATWIHQQRWTDQPAAAPQRGPPARRDTFASMLADDLRESNGRYEPDHDDDAPTLDLDPIR